eukprot:22605-Amphidinium_carterae.2
MPDRNYGQTTYVAKVGFEWLSLRGRARKELGQAVDDHVVLVAIKLRVLKRRSCLRYNERKHCSVSDLDQRLREAVPEVLRENGLTARDLGLSAEVHPVLYGLIECTSSSRQREWKLQEEVEGSGERSKMGWQPASTYTRMRTLDERLVHLLLPVAQPNRS